jgi:phenylacetate-CoA ligase
VYNRLPRSVQEAIVHAEALRIRRRRYNRRFHQRLEAATRRAESGERTLIDYRTERLEKMLTLSVRNDVIHEPVDERLIAEDPYTALSMLPISSKQDVIGDPSRFILPRPRDSRQVSTSGTTGSALKFTSTRRAEQEQWATWWRYRTWHGIDFGTWHGLFGSKPVVPVDADHNFWRTARPLNQVFYSSYHVEPGNIDAYITDIALRELTWLHGFPSVIAALARMALTDGIAAPDSIRILSFGAEELTEHDRATLQSWFSGQLIMHYGLAEGVANISQRPEGCLHVDEDFAFVEFIPTGDPDIFELVGTNLTNDAQAFIRYRTGDLVSHVGDFCECGAPGRTVRSIVGRRDDVVVGRTGRVFGRLDGPFKETPSVRSALIHQKAPGAIDIYLFSEGSAVTKDDRATIDSKFELLLGDGMDVRVHENKEFPVPIGLKRRLVYRTFPLDGETR